MLNSSVIQQNQGFQNVVASALGRVGGCDKLGSARPLILQGLWASAPHPEKFFIYNIEASKCHFQHSVLQTDLPLA